MIEITASGESCLCDFTFDFYWKHKGARLNPDLSIYGSSFRKLVEALRKGETVQINGDAGNRLGSSMGVDLVKFGGNGGPILSTGKIIVEGDVGNRMGISMLRGAIYVGGEVEQPLGNVIEMETDISGYRKYVSITEVLECSIPVLEPNLLQEKELLISDGLLRDTIGARSAVKKAINVDGNVGMSTGILIGNGQIDVTGNSDRNTGVLMKGGRILVRGSSGDFTGAEMKGGEIIIGGSAGSYICAKMQGGAVYAKEGKPVPPAKDHMPSPSEITAVAKALGLNPIHAMMFKRFGL